jgi:hypothetical protein
MSDRAEVAIPIEIMPTELLPSLNLNTKQVLYFLASVCLPHSLRQESIRG